MDLTDIAYLEQLETRSDPGRDPRGRVLATAYLALVSADVEPRIPADTAWHPVQDLPPTAFDHGSIAGSGRDRLRAKLSYTNIGFALAPETFTIAQLRDIYAASLGHPVSATNLQRVLTRRGVIEATPAAARPTSAGGRPATLYRFAARTLVVTNPFAAFRPPNEQAAQRPRASKLASSGRRPVDVTSRPPGQPLFSWEAGSWSSTSALIRARLSERSAWLAPRFQSGRMNSSKPRSAYWPSWSTSCCAVPARARAARRRRLPPSSMRALTEVHIVAGSAAGHLAGLEQRGAPFGQIRGAPGVPLVGVAGGDAEHARPAGADQERQRRLDRLGVAGGVGDVVELAVERGGVLAPASSG